MQKITKILPYVLLILLNSLPSLAQSVSLKVNNSVIEGQQFNLSISVTNGDAQVTRNNAPQLEGCTLLAGPGVSTMQSVQIINGRQSTSLTRDYNFAYIAEKAGTITIPPIKLVVNGREISTQAKTLTILPADKATSQRSYGGAYPPSYGFMNEFEEMEALLNELMGGPPMPSYSRQQQPQPEPIPQPQVNTNQPTKVTAKDIIVDVKLSKSSAYENEAIVATIKVYTKYDIPSFQVVVMPQFEGFLSEELDVPAEDAKQENYNGEKYYSLVLKKCLLYPQKAGKLTINSGTYDVTLRTEDYVAYGPYLTPVVKDHKLTTTSKSVSVDVKPLPKPAPASFSGAVGDFKVSAELEPEQLRTNEAARYVLTVKGKGNLKQLVAPTINFPVTLETYKPTRQTDANFDGSNMEGTFTATYTIVPQQTGELNIPAIEYSYFNPRTGQYVTTTLPEFTRDVTKGIPAPSGSANRGLSNDNLDSNAITDIRHIMTVDESKLSDQFSPVFYKIWYWLIYLLILISLVTVILIYRSQIKARADIQGRRVRRARGVATSRLRKAHSAMKAHDSDRFYSALSSALWGFMSDKLKIPASSLTRDNIAVNLMQAGASEDDINRTIDILDQCEMARFTPNHSDTEMSHLYNSASALINDVARLKK